jgi:hypothetical protein
MSCDIVLDPTRQSLSLVRCAEGWPVFTKEKSLQTLRQGRDGIRHDLLLQEY